MGKTVEDVSDADREQTKRVVYSVMYGIGKYFYIQLFVYFQTKRGRGLYWIHVLCLVHLSSSYSL